MPGSIVSFERVAFSALILGLVSIALNWPALSLFYDQNPAVFVLVQTGTFGGQFLLIWLISRKRKNWARWVWIGTTFGGTALGIATAVSGAVPFIGLFPAIASCLVYLVSLWSAFLLLTPTARAWFGARLDEQM